MVHLEGSMRVLACNYAWQSIELKWISPLAKGGAMLGNYKVLETGGLAIS